MRWGGTHMLHPRHSHSSLALTHRRTKLRQNRKRTGQSSRIAVVSLCLFRVKRINSFLRALQGCYSGILTNSRSECRQRAPLLRRRVETLNAAEGHAAFARPAHGIHGLQGFWRRDEGGRAYITLVLHVGMYSIKAHHCAWRFSSPL